VADVGERARVASCSDLAGHAPVWRNDTGCDCREGVRVLWVHNDLFVRGNYCRIGAVASQGLDERADPLGARVKDAVFATWVVVAVAEGAVLAGLFPWWPRPSVWIAAEAVKASFGPRGS
jgi:hypothetical protein